MVAPADTPVAPVSSFNMIGSNGLEREASIAELRAGFAQGYVFELIDLNSLGPALQTHVMVLSPRAYSLSEPFQVTLTPTEDNSVISEQVGIVIREITLEGTYGLKTKTAGGFSGAQGTMSGTAHFNDLRNMFRRYSALKKDPARSSNIQMIFHAMRDDDHFVVEPRSFETPRDTQTTRVHYSYRIALAAIAPASDSRLLAALDRGIAHTNALQDIMRAVSDIRAGFGEVVAATSSIKRKVGNIEAVMTNIAQLVNLAGAFLSGTASLIKYPLQLAATLCEQIDLSADKLTDGITDINPNGPSGLGSEQARSLRRMAAAIDRMRMYPDKWAEAPEKPIADLYDGEKRLTNSDVANNTGGATIGSRIRIATGSAADAGADFRMGTGVEVVTLERTDTIDSLATRAGTTPGAVIILNNLRPPYIAPGGGPGLLAPGDSVVVPARTAAGQGTQPSGGYLSAEDVLYGADMCLDPSNLANGGLEIKVDETGDSLDCEISTGIPNVIQGTQITVLTERGTTQFIPELGISRTAGVKGTAAQAMLASIRLREAILSDPRITGIQSLRVVLDGDVLTQEVTPIVTGRRSGVKLVLPFGRASGEGG